MSYMRRGVDPPESATQNRPRAAIAARATSTRSWAAARLTASASGYRRIALTAAAALSRRRGSSPPLPGDRPLRPPPPAPPPPKKARSPPARRPPRTPEHRHRLPAPHQDAAPARSRRDDPPPHQGAAVALDQVEARIDLIGPVDREVDDPLVEARQRHAEVPGQSPGILRRRHASHRESLPDPRPQRAHERGCGPAGAEADPHPVANGSERAGG